MATSQKSVQKLQNSIRVKSPSDWTTEEVIQIINRLEEFRLMLVENEEKKEKAPKKLADEKESA